MHTEKNETNTFVESTQAQIETEMQEGEKKEIPKPVYIIPGPGGSTF